MNRSPLLFCLACFFVLPLAHGQNPDAARRLEEIKVRRAELEKGFIAELHRLNRLLSAHDQMLQMQAAGGTIKPVEAVAQLKRKGIDVFERGFTEQEYQAVLKELQSAGERFFSMAGQKIDFASRWPSDKSEAEYQQLARNELAKARASFEQLWSRPTESAFPLEQANKVIGWSQGYQELPAERKFFAGQSQRVVEALAEARVKTFLELSQPASAPAAPPPQITNPSIAAIHPAITNVAVNTNASGVSGPVMVGAQISPQAVEHYSRGVQLAAQAQWREAEAQYRAAIQIDGREGLFHLGLGNALMTLGRVQEAEPSYRAAVQARPTVKEGYQGWGNALYQLQRFDESTLAYQQLVRLAPETAEFHAYLAYPLLMTRRWPEAEATLREALRLAPGRADYWTGLGNVFYQTQRFPDAANAYRQALQITPNFAQGNLFLALSLEAGQRTVEARDHFRRAYALDPNHPQIAIEYANSLARAGQWTEAGPVYATAARLNPQDSHALRGLGHARMAAGQFGEAEKAYRAALQFNTQLGVLHADLAGSLFRQNRSEEARAAAQQAAQLGDRTHWVFGALGLQ